MIGRLLESKCKFTKTCKWYAKDNPTCNKDGGTYSSWDKKAGCWVRNQEALNGKA
jgi:hypothetical protein